MLLFSYPSNSWQVMSILCLNLSSLTWIPSYLVCLIHTCLLPSLSIQQQKNNLHKYKTNDTILLLNALEWFLIIVCRRGSPNLLLWPIIPVCHITSLCSQLHRVPYLHIRKLRHKEVKKLTTRFITLVSNRGSMWTLTPQPSAEPPC